MEGGGKGSCNGAVARKEGARVPATELWQGGVRGRWFLLVSSGRWGCLVFPHTSVSGGVVESTAEGERDMQCYRGYGQKPRN